MKKRVCMIDDDEELCMELSEVLADEGYEVRVMHNGLEGRDHLCDNDYDLVLLDLKVPGLSGFDVLKDIKKRKPGLKVLVLSGRPAISELKKFTGTYNEEEENTLKSADAFLNKPFDITVVLGKIKEMTN